MRICISINYTNELWLKLIKAGFGSLKFRRFWKNLSKCFDDK